MHEIRGKNVYQICSLQKSFEEFIVLSVDEEDSILLLRGMSRLPAAAKVE